MREFIALTKTALHELPHGQVTEAAHAGPRTHAEQPFARESASRLAMKFGMSVRME
jgi:hypothetical protein